MNASSNVERFLEIFDVNIFEQVSLNYEVLSYVKYEFGARSDEAKKALELATVESLLSSSNGQSTKRSLDIGCATGRYPIWFAQRGYAAKGYDINDCAVRISRAAASNYPMVEIEQKDVLRSPPEAQTYDIITCMMGTFNHIERSRRHVLIDWAWKSLRSQGLLLLSCWNASCPYMEYLTLYTREQAQLLTKHGLSDAEAASALESRGFSVVSIVPFCFLPNACYDAWLGQMATTELAALDSDLRSRLDQSNAQMFLVSAVKP